MLRPTEIRVLPPNPKSRKTKGALAQTHPARKAATHEQNDKANTKPCHTRLTPITPLIRPEAQQIHNNMALSLTTQATSKNPRPQAYGLPA